MSIRTRSNDFEEVHKSPMNLFRRSFFLTLIAGGMLIAAFWAGYFVRDRQESPDDLPILLEARRLLLEHGYYPPPPDPSLEYGMIRGMLQAYNDPYTTFSEPAQHELTSNNLAGKFGGIGVQLQRDQEGYIVLIPIRDSPAFKAGIQEGDRLVQVDSQRIQQNTSVDTAQAALRGDVGSIVRITIQRPPEYQEFSYSIQRIEYILPSVNGYLSPLDARLGVIKVNIMAETTPAEISDTIIELQKRGAKAFALDLRDNFGGLLTSGVETARLFLSQGEIMREQYRDQEPRVYAVEKRGSFSEFPLVVLVNHNTASAAEITAGALQVHRRATLIGSQTFGKYTVQLVFELQDKSSLQVTSARWWIPGTNIGALQTDAAQGIVPDLIVADSPENGVDPAIRSAIEFLFEEPKD